MDDIDYSGMSKAERKKLKKERKGIEKERERTERDRKRRNRKIRKYGIIILIIVGIIAFFYWRSIPPKNAPIMEITPESYNFGQVSQAKGTVSTTMTIRNIGVGDLILKNMDTTCGCTSAAIVKNGIEGPRFSMSMHGTNPKDWREIIPAGQSVELKVYYDPNVHREMRGSFKRSVMVYSNDPMNKMKEVQISGIQAD